jgi:hypothetical protein
LAVFFVVCGANGSHVQESTPERKNVGWFQLRLAVIVAEFSAAARRL